MNVAFIFCCFFVALFFLTASCSSASQQSLETEPAEPAEPAEPTEPADASTGQETIFEVENPGIRAQFAASCESIDSKNLRCTTELPIGLEGGVVGYNFGRPPMNLFDFNRKEIRDLFSAGANLTYSITSGNPRLVLENIVEGNVERIAFTGFQMDAANGRLNVRDPYLLARNSSLYMDAEELEYITSAHYTHEKRYQFACGKNTVCPVGTEYEINKYFVDYSFARTEDFDLSIRASNKNLASEFVDVNLTIKANRHALSLKENCPSIDRNKAIEHWLCVRTGEIIPTPPVKLVTTSAMQNNLPDDLVLAKDQYELVANIEFDSLEETKRYMDSYTIDDPNYVEVKNGKLIFHHRKTNLAGGKCSLGSPAAAIGTHRRFEIGLGYFEIKFDEHPNLPASGGHILFWSRYGMDHSGFGIQPPERLLKWAVINEDGLTPRQSAARARRRLARIGFTEIDYIERGHHSIVSAFNLFAWPVKPYVYTKGAKPNQYDSHFVGRWYSRHRTSWPFVTNARSRTRKNNPELYFSTTLGIELSPKGINIFKDGKPQFSTPTLASAVGGAAYNFYMHGLYSSFPLTVPHFLEGSVTIGCDDIRDDEPFVIDYIRLYKPTNGYRAK